MNTNLLKQVWPKSRPITVEVYEGTDENVIHGVIREGDQWYRVEDGIIDILPDELADHVRRKIFADKHGLEYSVPEISAEDMDEEIKQKKAQIDFFKTDSSVYDKHVSNRVYYRASEKLLFEPWSESLPEGGLVLDLGAGTGRQTVPLVQGGRCVLSTDISEEMLYISREETKKTGDEAKALFVLADSETMELEPGVFDGCVCNGALHHVENPDRLIALAASALKPGGSWFSADPHASSVRFIFDWLMKVFSLHDELASDETHFTKDVLEPMFSKVGFKPKTIYHFYLPPHILFFLPLCVVKGILAFTDALFRHSPIKRWAGFIVMIAEK